MARRLRINGSAFLLPMVMAANIGGTATLIGDPPNVLIGADPRSGLTFLSFIENLTVACTFMLIVLVWYSRRYYPADVGSAANADRPEAIVPSGAELQNVPLLRTTAWIALAILLGFLTHSLTHMPVAVPAVIGVAAILFAQDYYYLKDHKPTAEERQHGVLAILEKDIEWPTLAFFLFLFILVGAAVSTGMIESLAHALAWTVGRISSTAGLSPQGDAAGRRTARALGLGLPVGGDRQHPLHRRDDPAGGEPDRAAAGRTRRAGPVVGAGARRLPGRQRHADRRLGQRHRDRPRREGRPTHLLHRVHRLRRAGHRHHARRCRRSTSRSGSTSARRR